MTPQELFNKAATHLLAQNQKSVKGDKCVYRHPDGFMCALGCLIPDELYKPAIETKSAHFLVCDKDLATLGYTAQQISDFATLGFTHDNKLLLADLQFIHDMHCTNDWPHKLRVLAISHGLSTEVLDNARL